MDKRLTPAFVIQWTKFTTGIAFSWPASSKTTRITKIILNMGWWISLIVAVAVGLPLITTAYKHRNNFIKFTESLSIAFCFVQIVVMMIIAKHHRHRLQYLIEQMETFVKNANPHEREVLENYVEREIPFYVRYYVFSLGAVLSYIFGPVVIDQPFPSIAEYPFPVDKHPVYDLVFVLEVIGSIQCFCNISFICQLCLLLWYGIIQLEFLGKKIKQATSSKEFASCIRVHQHTLWYIEETIKIVRPTVAVLIAIATITIACGSIHVVGYGPVLKKVQFAWIDIADASMLFCFAWTAENLTAASEKVSWALYNSPWILHSKRLKKDAIIVMQQCQNPPKIAIDGFMPNLSNEYYAK
ncbi:odorant receptor 50CTE, partial [Diachasma alloeum]